MTEPSKAKRTSDAGVGEDHPCMIECDDTPAVHEIVEKSQIVLGSILLFFRNGIQYYCT